MVTLENMEIFYILFALIFFLFASNAYIWLNTAYNHAEVTSEIKNARSDMIRADQTMDNRIRDMNKQYVNLDNRLKVTSSTVKSEHGIQLETNSQIKSQLSTLMNLGKIAEIGQVQISAVYSKTGQGGRVDSTTVLFKKPYSRPPQVIVIPIRLDADTQKNLRFEISVSKVTNSSFNVQVGTWENSQINSALLQYAVIV